MYFQFSRLPAGFKMRIWFRLKSLKCESWTILTRVLSLILRHSPTVSVWVPTNRKYVRKFSFGDSNHDCGSETTKCNISTLQIHVSHIIYDINNVLRTNHFPSHLNSLFFSHCLQFSMSRQCRVRESIGYNLNACIQTARRESSERTCFCSPVCVCILLLLFAVSTNERTTATAFKMLFWKARTTFRYKTCTACVQFTSYRPVNRLFYSNKANSLLMFHLLTRHS